MSRNRRGPRAIRSMLLSSPAVGAVEQNLPAVPGGHHPRRPVEHRTEVIPVPQFGLTGRQPHPHRQLQRPLCSDRGINRRPRRGERGAHPVAGVLEQKPAVRLDRPAQHLVVGGQRRPHRIGVGFPPTGRTLDIGEQKRHHPRRGSRPISGHPRRISQQTCSYLVHRRIRPGHRIHVVIETNFRESQMSYISRPRCGDTGSVCWPPDMCWAGVGQSVSWRARVRMPSLQGRSRRPGRR